MSRSEWVLARLLCLDTTKTMVRLHKCHEMRGGQEWVTRAGRGGEGVAVYNPGSGQCLVVRAGKIMMGLCGQGNSAVWKLTGLD